MPADIVQRFVTLGRRCSAACWRACRSLRTSCAIAASSFGRCCWAGCFVSTGCIRSTQVPGAIAEMSHGCIRHTVLLQGLHHQAILADLNTMAHGVARLSPHYCCDGMRFRTLGRSEAEW